MALAQVGRGGFTTLGMPFRVGKSQFSFSNISSAARKFLVSILLRTGALAMSIRKNTKERKKINLSFFDNECPIENPLLKKIIGKILTYCMILDNFIFFKGQKIFLMPKQILEKF